MHQDSRKTLRNKNPPSDCYSLHR